MTQHHEVIQSRKCGPFIVLSKERGLCTVQFTETGTITTARLPWVNARSVNDPYARTVAKIGYIGEGPNKATVHDEDGKSQKSPAYQLWSNMLQRCYIDPATGRRPTYSTVTVHPDWHNFQTFCNDIKQLDGYSSWLAYHAGLGGERIELDKDILCAGKALKEYGPNTCQFVTKSANLKAMWAARRDNTDTQ